MSDKSDVFRKLQKHLDKAPVGYPATESGIEIKVLKHLFTPQEAEIAVKLNFYSEPLSVIHKRVEKTGMTIEELENLLYDMYKKGTLNYSKRDNEKYFANAPIVIGMFEYQLNRLSKEFVKDVKQYLGEHFFKEEYNASGIPQLRTIPIETSLGADQNIAMFDKLKSIINTSKKIAVAPCICRQVKDLLEDPCKKTDMRDICFTFDRAADAYIERGFARGFSKEEAFQILEKVEDAGLVIQPGNSQRPMCICCCCGCCCEVLTSEKALDEPARFFATNFYAEVDEDSCIGCGVCEERCNMDAVHIEDALAHVDLSHCIGCGVCVPTCTSGAIKLVRKEQDIIPPESTAETYRTIMEKKAKISR